MPGLIQDVKKSVLNYKAELSALKNKSLKINQSICNTKNVLKAEYGLIKAELKELCGFQLKIHEDLNMKKCYFVPTEIHAFVGHIGGVANFKFNLIPGITNLVGEKPFQFGFRFGTEKIADVVNGEK